MSSAAAPPGTIYIKLNHAQIRIEGSADPVLLGMILESLRGWVAAGTRIWIVAGITDLRRGFVGLSAMVQTALDENPFSGHVFVFRGRRGV